MIFKSLRCPSPRSAATVRLLTSAVVLVSLAASSAGVAGAQDVYGHTPQSSPYRDISSPHELSILGGYLVSAKDPAGVVPQSAALVGIREMVHLGGPIMAFFRIQHSFSQRNVINPTLPASERIVETIPQGLTIADLNLGVNLTGDRSWHNLVPFFNIGAGAVSDLGAPHDIGGYRFGTSFAGTFGGGFRWVTSGPLSITISANNYIWSVRYPSSYQTPGADGTSVIPSTHKLIFYRNNGVYTLGLSYKIF